MLQESVDALFDNGRRGRPVTGPGNRPLKSLSDMLKGKQGRFRQNLLGKRVDYSGRSVIVCGPQLQLHQCGLPKDMAIELFKPFVMKRLVDLNHAQNIKSAKRMVERARPVVWDVLEEVITEHPVLLNRAPTLHRLGIQAFEPQLIEGKAIQIHPLVCTPFNADFDGDQMAVHVPLSAEAQAEARVLMLSSNNILKPADGKPVTLPTKDMVLGIYYLTAGRDGARGEDRGFSSIAEARMAFDAGELELQSRIRLRMRGIIPPTGYDLPDGWIAGDPLTLTTTLGRALFNQALPADYPFVEKEINNKVLGGIVNDLAERYAKVPVAQTLDRLKDLGFEWATQSGVTVAVSDIIKPVKREAILADAEAKADRIQTQYERGFINDDERRNELIGVWTKATAEVSKEVAASWPKFNPINLIVGSGATGNISQMAQIAGMRGLVSNPRGEIIPRPIKTNFREGLSVLEFFISTHGTRKGLADTALRTADSGYLTRRLVDVSQDIIVREDNCGTERGLSLPVTIATDEGGRRPADHLDTSLTGRILSRPVLAPDGGEELAAAGDMVYVRDVERFIAAGVPDIRVRSVLTCDSKVGCCARCYGTSLATGKLVDIGEAVGIIAAQSIGEPGTQLTMRTFHSGGVAGEDITHGLPRVVELFEARQPKGLAPIAESAGRVTIEDAERSRRITVIPDDGSEEIAYQVSRRVRLLVQDGGRVEVGTQLINGAVHPHEVLRILGQRAVQQHLIDEVQEVYRSQGVGIHDKHIEIVIRQMLRRVTVIESGDSELLPGELVERTKFETENRRVVAEGGSPASGRPVLMGITKSSLATDSWLSAASFQDTTRVLTEAAINAKSDPLLGLKENVIIGKLIPAGTGLARYRNIRVEPTEEAQQALYSMDVYSDAYGGYTEGYDPSVYGGDYGFGQGSGEAVPLEAYDLGDYQR